MIRPELPSRIPILEDLEVLEDLEPHSAPLQMALDEALLKSLSAPLLRVYRWKEPCVTVGYFEPIRPASRAFPSLPITRRWTGGGTVLHRQDWPYSLLVPASHPLAQAHARDSYRSIHSALLLCLNHLHPPASLAQTDALKVSSACFENPVQYDLLQGPHKIAGAGQKRTRLGLLHQGSVQLEPSQHPQTERFAEALAHRVTKIALAQDTLQQAQSISVERYDTETWTAKR